MHQVRLYLPVYVVHSQTVFYDVKPEDLHLRRKSYNTDLVLNDVKTKVLYFREKSYYNTELVS